MGWTTRNRHKSGSTPSLKYKVQIQSSATDRTTDTESDNRTDKNSQTCCLYIYLRLKQLELSIFHSNLTVLRLC